MGNGWGCNIGQYGVALTGSWSAQFLTGTSACGNQAVGCYPGQVFTAQAMIIGNASADGAGCCRIQFNNPSGQNFWDGNHAANNAGWNLSKVTCTAPAGATTVTFCMVVYGQTAGFICFDSCSMFDATISSSTGLNGQGSIVAGQSVAFNAAVSTSSSITISVPGQSLIRPDGSLLTVNASSVTFSGLTASTSYYFFPYIKIATGTLAFSNPTPPLSSTTNNPTYAAQMGLDGRYPATSSFILASTGSASNPTGGGGAIGDNTCPEGQELVTEKTKGNIKAIDVVSGDFLLGKCFATGEDVYRRVIQTRSQEAAIWRMVDGHRVSPCEPLWHEDGWKPAYKATGATIDRSTGTRIDISLDSDDYNEQNYYLVSGDPLLIHNTAYRPFPC